MFALDYIDMTDFIVVVEPDSKWFDALRITFQSYSDKVVIIDKFLSDHDDSDNVSVDTIIEQYLPGDEGGIVLKMDIEGYEEDVLRGANSFLKNNNARVIACTYHHQTAAEEIQHILSEYGFDHSYSNGYMYFPKMYEKQLFPQKEYSQYNAALRRGTIGARRRIDRQNKA